MINLKLNILFLYVKNTLFQLFLFLFYNFWDFSLLYSNKIKRNLYNICFIFELIFCFTFLNQTNSFKYNIE